MSEEETVERVIVQTRARPHLELCLDIEVQYGRRGQQGEEKDKVCFTA
jgi:hypothetical protein